MNLLNRTRAAVARAIAPTQQVRRFDAAGGGRRFNALPHFGSTAAATAAQNGTVRSRARYLYANNPHAHAAVEAWVTALVGTGARATPKHPDADPRKAIVGAIEDWSAEADICQRTDWYGMQANIARAMVLDGEALVMLIDTDRGLRLRQIPAELLASEETRDLGNGRQIISGVELDADGAPAAYWIRPEHPGGPFATWAPPQRYDATNVLHIFRPMGPGDVRGMSWLAPVLLKLAEHDEANGAVLAGLKTAAMFAGFLKPTTPSGDEAEPFRPDGAPVAPGAIKELPYGYDIEFNSPQQAQQTPEFLSAELRAVAVGMGVPAHLVSGDLTGANYGSLRADLVSFRQKVSQIQYGVLEPQLLRPVHHRAVISAVLGGRLAAPDFETMSRDWTAAEFIMPAQPWIDPAKDAAALRALIDAGLMSRREGVAERGWAVEDLDAEIAADQDRARRLGITFGVPAAAPRPATEEPASNADA